MMLPLGAQTQIDWISQQDATNFVSNGVTPMDADFRFELGVFSTGFTPTLANIAEWSVNWNPAQRTRYRADLKRYASSFTASDNAAPFTFGKATYVWGFKGDPTAGEWILFRASSWTWPLVGNGPPAFLIWDAKDATAVIGEIQSTGIPFLMKTESVADVVPPSTSYAQWVDDELQGETLLAAHEDADGDGSANILEFVFGTSPRAPGDLVMPTSSLLPLFGERYVQLSVPRRVDRPAILTVEVSSDLEEWFSGSGNTVEVSNTATSLVVRDLTPMSSSGGKRFIRLRATAP